MTSGVDAHSVGRLGAILLAGGRATRVGGAAKPLFEVGGRSLLRRAVEASASAGAQPITVAGPPVPGISVEWVREDPPFSGPAAAVVAALRSWTAGSDPVPDWTLLLACDLPRVDAAVARLVRDILLLPADSDGLCLADPSSRPQWLTGAYRTAALSAAAAALPDGGRHASIRALLDELAITVISAPAELTDDVDTWEDLQRARARAGYDAAGFDTARAQTAGHEEES